MYRFRRFLGTTAKIIAGIMIVALVGYAGACVYGNWIAKPEGTVRLPELDIAPYILSVKNTGTIVLASKVELKGPEIPGERTYILPDGYWELVKGGKFKYIKLKDFSMDEAIWGQIDLTRRTE
jgi:hypothetical protein